MLALKLKIMPTEKQAEILDAMFWKWASICSRIAKMKKKVSVKENKKELSKKIPSNSDIWFSKTQLCQAEVDVGDHKKALKNFEKRQESLLDELKYKVKAINEVINDESKREIDPNNPSKFRIKDSTKKGNLNSPKFFTLKKWQKILQENEKRIKKKESTIEKLKRGNIFFNPTKISLHEEEYSINFGSSKLLLNCFYKYNKKSGINSDQLENKFNEFQNGLNIICSPLQPIRGSSKRSFEFIRNSIINFLMYSLYAKLFGIPRSVKALMKSNKDENKLKLEEKLKKKKSSFNKTVKEFEKMIGRKLSDNESKILNDESKKFFEIIKSNNKYIPSEEYLKLLKDISEEIYNSNIDFKPYKYSILIRKPLSKFKSKKLYNLKPTDYKYYLQLSYEPFSKQLIATKTILGIDRGLKHLLAVSVFDPSQNKFVYNKLIKNPVFKWKKRYHDLKRSIRNRERRIRALTGVHIHENQLIKKLKSMKNKINVLYHNVSKNIVDLAKKYESTIVLERLENLKQHGRSKGKRYKKLNYVLSNFDYKKIESLISYKAKKEGVPVSNINPKYTSKTCAKCLLEVNQLSELKNEYNRDSKNSKIGICNIHGQIDADLNAARVIALCYSKNLNEPHFK